MRRIKLAVLFFIAAQTLARGGEDPPLPQSVKGRLVQIQFSADEDLKKLAEKIKANFRLDNYKELFSAPGNCPYQACEKLDRLVLRVEEILDMRPLRFQVVLKLYKSAKELQLIYQQLFGQSQDLPAAFYVHRYLTIFAAADKLNEHIIAHEIGHAVLNQFFVVKPSIKMQEVLCQYIDVHLYDD